MAKSASGSIRQRSNGRWEGRITTGTNTATGKPIRQSVYGSTQKEVRQKLTEIQRELDKGIYVAPNKVTVSTWMEEWLKLFCENKIKPLTYSSYDTAIRNHVNPHIGEMELQKVKGVDIQKIYNDMIAKGLSPKTVKNASAIMHKAFKMAVKQGLMFVNPCDNAELPKIIKKEIRPLDDEAIKGFLKAIEESPYRNAFALCLFAGLREGECLGLPWSNVDFENHQITISQQLQRSKEGAGYYIAHSTKSNKPRTIQPPEIAFTYLKNEKVRQAENRLKAGKLWDNPENLVFTTPLGNNIAIVNYYKAFKRIAKDLGIPEARPHDLRHTCATVAISNHADLKSVQELLGHATPSFTLSVYAHVTNSMKQETADKLDNYYEKIASAT